MIPNVNYFMLSVITKSSDNIFKEQWDRQGKPGIGIDDAVSKGLERFQEE